MNGVMDMGYAIENAEKLLEDAADRMFRFIKAECACGQWIRMP